MTNPYTKEELEKFKTPCKHCGTMTIMDDSICIKCSYEIERKLEDELGKKEDK